jgi:ubiquinol-cytochrome c reductase cytochrome b subunit
MLNYLGLQPPTGLGTLLSQIGTVYYFAYFFGLMFMHKFEQSKPVPERVTG